MGDLATLTWQFRQLADGTTRKFQQFTGKNNSLLKENNVISAFLSKGKQA